jgi:hypothetical protein
MDNTGVLTAEIAGFLRESGAVVAELPAGE